jgi:hypothetical protein
VLCWCCAGAVLVLCWCCAGAVVRAATPGFHEYMRLLDERNALRARLDLIQAYASLSIPITATLTGPNKLTASAASSAAAAAVAAAAGSGVMSLAPVHPTTVSSAVAAAMIAGLSRRLTALSTSTPTEGGGGGGGGSASASTNALMDEVLREFKSIEILLVEAQADTALTMAERAQHAELLQTVQALLQSYNQPVLPASALTPTHHSASSNSLSTAAGGSSPHALHIPFHRRAHSNSEVPPLSLQPSASASTAPAAAAAAAASTTAAPSASTSTSTSAATSAAPSTAAAPAASTSSSSAALASTPPAEATPQSPPFASNQPLLDLTSTGSSTSPVSTTSSTASTPPGAAAPAAASPSAAAEPVDPNAIKMSITRPTGEVLVHPTAATGAPQS